MEKEFFEGDYTVTVTASPDNSQDEGKRFRADVVIRRTGTDDVLNSFFRYVAAAQGTLRLDDAIYHGLRAARENIEAGFPRD
ncbi:hypothetical protein ACGTRS_25690 [Burkholderia semiarida]|uniref:Uncharacterized protein n=1 Tax=Burkholderia semiarida TaxID=2843303 RepID=A0ABW7L9N9_9BURK